MVGGSGNDNLTGSTAANSLTGNQGNDLLVGGAGIDTLSGGIGSDTFEIDDGDLNGVGEVMDGGADADRIRIRSDAAGVGTTTVDLRDDILVSIDEIEFANDVGDLRVQINAAQIGAGVSSSLLLDGFSSSSIDDTFRVFAAGQAVVDLSGFTFQDWNTINTNTDMILVYGGAESNTLTGTSQRDDMDGSGGDDTLNGGDAADTLEGGLGNDVLNGGDDSDWLLGEVGNDTLNGNAGQDTMEGGRHGNDSYFVDTATDGVDEAAGEGTFDKIATSVDYILAAGVEVERLNTTSAGGLTAIDITGNAIAQEIIGNAGDNILSDGGGAGADTLTGSAGNDLYIVRNAATLIVEGAGAGVDRVSAGLTFVLAADDDVEELTTTSSGGVTVMDLTGNALAQTITGNDGANVLHTGNGAADSLVGNGGDDTYRIFNSADTITEAAGDGAADRGDGGRRFRVGRR